MMKLTRREALALLAGAAVTGVVGTAQAADGYRDVSPPQRPIGTDGKSKYWNFSGTDAHIATNFTRYWNNGKKRWQTMSLLSRLPPL